LLREFSDYRRLFYGVALMGVMLYRPEGLWPTKIARRELHAATELLEMDDADLTERPSSQQSTEGPA
jgi:branched-chain amino acid transport system permease protein